MKLASLLKSTLPEPIINTLKSLRPPPPPRDPFAPFVLSQQEIDAARTRGRQIDWMSEAPQRILYGLVPTAELRNVGDHAQIVAIQAWMARHYPGIPVVELDKNVVFACQDEIALRARPNDLVFLHSGGNLGDRGIWSETARRILIEILPNNRIVSLPQTIYFSDTPVGAYQSDVSSALYGQHGHLTVMGRDEVSSTLAQSLFPHSQILTMPDFVLSLSKQDFDVTPIPENKGKILMCLRMDPETVFTQEERVQITGSVPLPTTSYDTDLADPIEEAERIGIIADTIALFDSHDAIVTDRFHGLIFGVLCKKPVVVLGSIDHKLTSALSWFKDIANVVFCEEIKDIERCLREAQQARVETYPNFNTLYFDHLPGLITQMDRNPDIPALVLPAIPANR